MPCGRSDSGRVYAVVRLVQKERVARVAVVDELNGFEGIFGVVVAVGTGSTRVARLPLLQRNAERQRKPVIKPAFNYGVRSRNGFRPRSKPVDVPLANEGILVANALENFREDRFPRAVTRERSDRWLDQRVCSAVFESSVLNYLS